MKLKTYITWLPLFMVVISLTCTSCIYDEYTEEAKDDDNIVRLVVKLETLVPSSRAPENQNEVLSNEQMHSCRIIMLDDEGKLEVNRHIIFPKGTDSYKISSQDIYDLIYTTSGWKHFFIIANEETIGSLWGSQGDLIDVKNNQTLSDWLSNDLKFISDPKTVLNSLWFSPNYSTDSEIPMSSYYYREVAEGEQELSFYLVRIATKFQFNFENYRNEDVIFKEINLHRMADKNYLMPHIDNPTMDGNYWIDWLKDVVDDTNQHPELNNSETSNDIINEKWGWLTSYSLPDKAEHNPVKFNDLVNVKVPQSDSQTGSSVPDPGKYNTGYYYYPESKYIPDISGNLQNYSLEFIIQKANDEPPIIIKKDLGNVKTLFRDTYVIVNIRMYTGVEDIYVEIKNWVKRDWVFGTINPY